MHLAQRILNYHVVSTSIDASLEVSNSVGWANEANRLVHIQCRWHRAGLTAVHRATGMSAPAQSAVPLTQLTTIGASHPSS